METLNVISLASLVLLIGGIAILVLGIIQIFSKGWFNWRVKQVKKAFGSQVKSSPLANKFGGVMLIILGIFLIGGYLFLKQQLRALY